MGLKEQTLTPEQMNTLKALGVDTTKASVVLIFKDEDGNEIEWNDITFENGEPVFIEGCGEGPVYKEYFDAETGDYDNSYREDCGVFTLHDILTILPCGKTWDTWQWQITGGGDEMEYNDGDGTSPHVEEFGNLLEKAYNMLVWAVEYGLFKKHS